MIISRTENTSLRVRKLAGKYGVCMSKRRTLDLLCVIDCRLNYKVGTQRALSSRSCHDIKCSLLVMRYICSGLSILPLPLSPYTVASPPHLLLGTVQWPGEVWELENRRTVSALQCKTVQVCGIQRACRLVKNNLLMPFACVWFVSNSLTLTAFHTLFFFHAAMSWISQPQSLLSPSSHTTDLCQDINPMHSEYVNRNSTADISAGSSKHLSYSWILHLTTWDYLIANSYAF